MNIKTLSPQALFVIEQFLHFKTTSSECNIPYFNNKTARNRMALRAAIGKGSVEEIREELQTYAVKHHIDPDSLDNIGLKKLLVDLNLGIDCSGFVYYVLKAEFADRGHGDLGKHIKFVNCRGLIGRLRCSLRPVENCDVATLSSDQNSSPIELGKIQPGDLITMAGDGTSNDRDHVLVINEVQYRGGVSEQLAYSQAVAYAEDGVYGTGVRQGTISINDASKPLLEQKWHDERIFSKASKSKTELRRMKAFMS